MAGDSTKKGEGNEIIIEYEGEKYPLNIAEFTGRECSVLKSVGHIHGVGEIPQALIAGDLEAVVALAVIAMKRAGVVVNPDELLDAEVGVIRINIPDDENPTSGATERPNQTPPPNPEEPGLPS